MLISNKDSSWIQRSCVEILNHRHSQFNFKLPIHKTCDFVIFLPKLMNLTRNPGGACQMQAFDVECAKKQG